MPISKPAAGSTGWTSVGGAIIDVCNAVENAPARLDGHDVEIDALQSDVVALQSGGTGGGSGGSGGTVSLPAAVLYRLVQRADGTYPTRPTTGYVDFLGPGDPGNLLQPGDTWTQTASAITAPAAPGAPTIGAASGGNAAAFVSFTPPTSNGGAPITGYVVTSTPGNIVGSGTSSPVTVTGLTNGQTYTFKVQAVNSAGSGASSVASNSVTPANTPTVPSPPTIGAATGGNASASVAFTPSASTGGSPITGYTVTSSPGGITGTGTISPISVPGLVNGTVYTFTVRATNALGNSSPSSASNSVTPAAPPVAPGAPTIGTATPGDGSVSVAFTAPASSGGAAITQYTATSTPGGFTGTGSSSPVSVDGLVNGTAYTFKVKATNSAGTGPDSAASNSATPTGSPTALTDPFSGSDGGAWSSSVWTSTIASDVTADIQSNQGRFVWTATAFNDRVRRFAPAVSGNWRCRGQIVAAPAISGWTLSIAIQGTVWDAGVPNPETAYELRLTNGTFYVLKLVSQASTSLVASTPLTGLKWWDFQVVGGVLKYRVWTGVLADAPAWTTVTNSAPITGTGGAGLIFSSGDTGGSADFRVDNVLIDNNPA